MFIHGESFQWNSGSTIDGTVLASYSNLVVVTINYRLGLLGKWILYLLSQLNCQPFLAALSLSLSLSPRLRSTLDILGHLRGLFYSFGQKKSSHSIPCHSLHVLFVYSHFNLLNI